MNSLSQDERRSLDELFDALYQKQLPLYLRIFIKFRSFFHFKTSF